MPFRVEALGKSHDRSAFTCGSDALDRYLQQQARQDADKRVAASFVLVEPPSAQVQGYYTLSASVIHVEELPDTLARKLPRYPQLPVTLLGRLAVAAGLNGLGMGQFLLMDALWQSLGAATQIGAMAILVDAKDEVTAAFYARFGFIALQRQPGRLFLPMKTVAQLFG
jgi:predicted GNAT family N-acyltransferase